MIKVNYKERAWTDGLTVESLLRQLSEDKSYQFLKRGRVTVIVNNEVIPPAVYGQKEICEGDEIRIYPFIAGG